MQLAASLLATVVFGGYFFTTVDWGSVWLTLAHVDLFWLAFAACFLLLHELVRAIRIQTFVLQKGQSLKLVTTCVLQSCFGVLLPSGLAQVAFVYMLKALHAVGVVRALSGMLVMRFIDLVLFAFLALITVSWADAITESDIDHIIVTILMLLLLTSVGLGLVRKIYDSRAFGFLTPSNWFVKALDTSLDELVGVIHILLHPKPILATVVMWAAMFGAYAALCLSIGVELSLPAGILAFSLLMLINLLPIHGVAGVGTHHLAWYLVLVAVGVADEPAKVIAASSHLLLIVLSTAWAVPAPLVLIFISRHQRQAEGAS